MKSNYLAARAMAGFTLVELMIVVAIIAILAAIAVPSYTSYVSKANRADARGQLMQAGQFMQKFYGANDKFDTDRAGNNVIDQIPDSIKRSPADGTKLYDLSVTATAGSYTLTMAPTGKMTSDACGSYTLTSTGVRGVSGASLTRDACWK